MSIKNWIIIFFIFLSSSFFAQQNSENLDPKWWKEAIVYQIYPRSFKDSDGDGIGDLKGIISKLDYLKKLGITAVWLNPIYTSPNDDNGYDISDYKNIMKEFGSLQDFDSLIQGLHRYNIKFIMDVVVNHCSDEHEWFKQSRRSRNNPYRNYFHWWNAEKGTPPYRYSLFDIEHNAWKYDSLTNAYYLHYFSVKQPDLNWENPQMRKDIYDMMKFWASKGVDGFRLDAFQFCAKDTTFPLLPQGFEKNFVEFYAMGKNIHNYLEEMNKEVFSQFDVLSVAEGAGRNFNEAHELVDANRKELNIAYAFEAVDIPKAEGYSLLTLKQTFSKWDSAFKEKGWLAIFLANHDQARMVSRFGNDNPQWRDLSSKMLTTFILTMRGTPYYYNGDELGMMNIKFNNIEDYNDLQVKNEYQYQKNNGGNLNKFLHDLKATSRDNGRTPFQWNNKKNSGFSTHFPWIKVNTNFTFLNATAQEKNKNSTLQYFKKMVRLRKKNKTWVYGTYTEVDKNNPYTYTYTRTLNDTTFLVSLNFSIHNTTTTMPENFNKKTLKLVSTNYNQSPIIQNTQKSKLTLRPYEAIIYQIQ